jgi:hypothetical protein
MMPRSTAVDQSLLAKLQALSEQEVRFYRLLIHYQKDLVIALALADAVPVIGFVHCAITGRFPVLLAYVAVGAILLVAGRPRGQAVLNRAEGMQYLG